MGKPNPKCIDECKRLLAWAEKGDITDMSFVAYGEQIFTVGYHWSVPAEIPHIAGETSALVTAINNDMLRGRMPQTQQHAAKPPFFVGQVGKFER